MSPPTHPPLSPTEVVIALQQRPGKYRGIATRNLVRDLTGKPSTPHLERCLRTVVEDLRLRGYPICALPAYGYWWAESADEVREVCTWHRARSLHSLKIASRLLRDGIPMLSGQLPLPGLEPTPAPIYQGVVSFQIKAAMPLSLKRLVMEFLSQHPHWNEARLLTSALALFLMQAGLDAEPYLSLEEPTP
jgi:hypothetical protein